MTDLAENISPDKPSVLVAEINLNPLKIELEPRDALDWPHIHFCISAVYSKAVLKGLAFLPHKY
jgi:hypothetical protein